MTELTIKQQQVLALARARRRRAEAGNPPPKGMTAQQAAEQAMSGAMTENRDREARAMPAAARASTSLAGGLPFVGEWVDEGIGAIDPAAGERYRAMQRTFAEDNPKTDTALRVGGAIAGSIPLAMGGAGLAGAAGLGMPASVGGRVVGGSLLGALGGGAEGAVSGAGVQEDRQRNAVERGMLGAGIGGAVGGLVPLAGLGAGAAMNAFGRRAAPAGMDPAVADIVGGIVEAEGAQGIRQMRQSGPDAMIADAGRGPTALLDAVTQRPGGAARVAQDAVADRTNKAAGELTGALDTTLGAPRGIREMSAEVRQGMAPIVKDAYDTAYQTPIDYAGKGQAIEAVLDRVPPRVMREALDEADEIMRFEGITNRQIKANIADDGTVTFEQMPDVMQLDMLKRGLDKVVDAGTDATTGKLTPAARRAAALARELRGAVARAVPEYRTALALGSDKITRENAIKFGSTMLRPQVTREQVAEFIGGLTEAEARYVRQGLRSYIDDTTANVRRTMTDANTDAREGAKALGELSSRAAREKLAMLLGNDAPALQRQIDRTARAYGLRAGVAENSKTAVRQAFQGRIEELTQPGAIGTLLEGAPGSAAQQLMRGLSGMTGEARAAAEDRIAMQIAELLTGPRGNEATRRAIALVRYMRSTPETREIAEKADRFVTSAGAVAYPAGTRSLEQPR